MKYNHVSTQKYFENICLKLGSSTSGEFNSCNPTLIEIYHEEGGISDFNKTEKVVNLDCIDNILVRKHERYGEATMDFSFIITNDNQEEIVFSDFKLRTTSGSNLQSINKNRIRNKIKNSTETYSLEIPTFANQFLIFRKEVVPVAISRINRQYNNQKHSIISIDINDFYQTFFSN